MKTNEYDEYWEYDENKKLIFYYTFIDWGEGFEDDGDSKDEK
jgi:hypothetical protein